MIINSFEVILLWLFSIAYLVVIAFATFSLWRSDDRRNRLLLPLVLTNLAALLMGIGTLYFLWDVNLSVVSDFLIYVGLFTVLVFVVTIEVPGFLLLSKYDEQTVNILEEIHENLVNCIFNLNEALKKLDDSALKNKERLQDIHIEKNLGFFIKMSKDIKNVDSALHNLLLQEVSEQTKQISDKSKHPFPKLVDVVSLAGLSFLIAQLLK